MISFEKLSNDDSVRDVIQSAFNSNLPVEDSWGYEQEDATIITSTEMPYKQLEHMFASMRAYLEMNMIQEESKRYGSINVNELSRDTLKQNTVTYHQVKYEITAIKELLYTEFIKEYKENYGKETFDLARHFQKRKEATLRREVTHWFKLSIKA